MGSYVIGGGSMSNIEIFGDEILDRVREVIKGLVDIYRDHQFFWSNAGGWATAEAETILSRSRLDWLHALSDSLFTWTDIYRTTTDNEGKLILAWTNLGALLEGGIKLFLSVHITSYNSSLNCYKDPFGMIIEPDGLSLEKLKVFLQKESLFDYKWYSFITKVQQRRNAIHAYKDRDIGTWAEFYQSIEQLYLFTKEIKECLPYPN
jgi:hypothetical protein